ncbi:MAG: single-stranded DNA-binding protein [Actinomycetes bacterium]
MACHGGHRPPGPRAGQTARPGNRKGQDHDRGSRELGRQPDRGPGVRYTGAGIARAMFRVAVSGRREQEASFFTVVVWRDQAEHAAESLRKGSRVVILGRLQQRSWAGEDGSARSTVEVMADELGPSLRWATARPTRAITSASEQRV